PSVETRRATRTTSRVKRAFCAIRRWAATATGARSPELSARNRLRKSPSAAESSASAIRSISSWIRASRPGSGGGGSISSPCPDTRILRGVMSSLVSMEAARTVQSSSPLGEFLRRRLEHVLARWEAGEGPAAASAGRAAIRRFLAAVDELGAAVEALLQPAGTRSERAAGCRVLLLGDSPADLVPLLQSG